MNITATIKSAQGLKKKAEQAERELRRAGEKSAQLKKRSDDHFIKFGRKLAELKEMKPKDITWPDFVKKHFGYSQPRADELIRIAGGEETLAQARARKAERMARTRSKKSNATNAGGTGSSDNVVAFKKPTPEEGDCNYDDGDPEQVKGDTKEQIRRQIFLNMAREWGIKRPTEVLDSAFFSKASPEEVTDDLFVEISAVIEAWNAIAAKLKRLQRAAGKVASR